MTKLALIAVLTVGLCACSNEITDDTMRAGDCFRDPPLFGTVYTVTRFHGTHYDAAPYVQGTRGRDNHYFDEWTGPLGCIGCPVPLGTRRAYYWRVACPRTEPTP